jgi:hypothetical protein
MELTLFNLSLTEPERQLADKMATYWSNFAKYGNPSPFITDDLPLWLPYSDKKVQNSNFFSFWLLLKLQQSLNLLGRKKNIFFIQLL